MTPITAPLLRRSAQNWLFLTPLLILIVWRLALAGTRHPFPWAQNGTVANTSLNTAGLALVGLGLLLRVLARGWKVENSQGHLVTTGLYAFIRHPLYVASFLIGLGLCLILGDPLVLVAYVVVYLLMHAWVIRGEERWLARHWGDEYRRYAARVPRFLPALASLRRRRVRPRDLTLAVAREADAICAWLTAAFLLLAREGLTGDSPPRAVVPLALAAACLTLWPSLKRVARSGRKTR
jgi:protein-S-isoprenylcysteine O-methyltransferase Ste14